MDGESADNREEAQSFRRILLQRLLFGSGGFQREISEDPVFHPASLVRARKVIGFIPAFGCGLARRNDLETTALS